MSVCWCLPLSAVGYQYLPAHFTLNNDILMCMSPDQPWSDVTSLSWHFICWFPIILQLAFDCLNFKICHLSLDWLSIDNMFVCLMVFNATFNNISVISWRSVLLVEETRGPWENHWPVASHWQTLSHTVVHLPWSRFELTTSVVIGTDCIGTGSCKSNFYTSRPRRLLDNIWHLVHINLHSKIP
jgi:hypothetical protein